MARRVKKQYLGDETECFKQFAFDCELTVAVNPVTYKECKLTPPVKIRCYEDFDKFYDQWEKFCRALGGSPDEVCFRME